MGYINLADKTINAKLVYYGVGLGGKTTSLQAIHEVLCPRNEVKLVSINTDQDATLLFDFLPLNLGSVEGFKIRIQGFTVPGQPKYKVMRKYVLSGADAVVFVIDSQASRLEENLKSLEDLKNNLVANGLSPDTIPLVLQYNKRDLPDLSPLEELDRKFKWREVPSFPTIATQGEGVFEAFVEATRLLVEAKILQYGLGKGTVDPGEVAQGAARKLFQIKETRKKTSQIDSPTFDRVTLSVPEEAAASVLGGGPGSRAGGAAPVTAERLLEETGTCPLAGEEPLPEEVEEFSPGGEELEELPVLEDLVEEEEEEGDTGAPAERSEPSPPEGDSEQLLGQVVQTNVELAELYAELAEYKNLLERKNNELVEISQTISHDLKKPLTALKTVISLLKQGYLGELSEQQADAVQNAYEASQYMEELIEDILDSTRLDHDGMDLKVEEVDMTLLVGEILRRLKYHLTETNVAVRVEPLPTVQCDPWAMTKVFTNLIGNAVNYRDPTRGPYIHLSAKEEEEGFAFLVEDNGIGIPEEDQEKVFRKFERGSNTGGINGTGLGLYIVRELVRKHGGDVTFTSRKGEGTTFRVYLPKTPLLPEEEEGIQA